MHQHAVATAECVTHTLTYCSAHTALYTLVCSTVCVVLTHTLSTLRHTVLTQSLHTLTLGDGVVLSLTCGSVGSYTLTHTLTQHTHSLTLTHELTPLTHCTHTVSALHILAL